MTKQRATRARRNAPLTPRRLTLHDFERTGAQDCGNTFTVDDFNIDDHLDPPDPKAAFDSGITDGEDWIDQQDVDTFDGLDPGECYRWWRSGYEQCAIPILTDAIEARINARLEDMTVFYLVAGRWDDANDDAVILESFSSKRPENAIRDALDMLARMDGGEIIHGDGHGPSDKLVFSVPGSDTLYWIMTDLNADDDTRQAAWTAIGRPRIKPAVRMACPVDLERHFVQQREALRARGYRWVETDTRAKK